MKQRAFLLLGLIVLVLIGAWMFAQREREMPPLDTDDTTAAPDRPPTLTGTAEAEGQVMRGDMQRVEPTGKMDAGGVISGLVLDDESGEPVPKAWVFQRGEEALIPSSMTSVTDQEGQFELREQAGPTSPVVCRAPGYLQAVSSPTASPDGLLTIRLARGASIQGRVIDDLGSPVANARVWAFSDANAAAWPHGTQWWLTGDEGQGGTALTDEEGRFRMRGLDPSLRLRVRAARTLYTSISVSDTVAVPGDDPKEIRLILVPVAELSISIVDAETGHPVRHAVMSMNMPRGAAMRRPTHYASLSGETGKRVAGRRVFRFIRYAASDLPEKPATSVSIQAHGYRPQTVEAALEFGVRNAHEIELERQPEVDFVPVRVRAEWKGGSPFSGLLGVQFWSAAYPGGQGVDLEFKEGWSVEEFYLPTGDYSVTTAGLGPTGVWWRDPDAQASCEITKSSDGAPSVCRVTLRGAVLRVRVESPEGVSLRGYGLAIVSPGGHSAWRQYWHQEYRASQIGATLTDVAEVLIPKGRFECHVKLSDGRQSHTEAVAGAAGELIEAVIVVR